MRKISPFVFLLLPWFSLAAETPVANNTESFVQPSEVARTATPKTQPLKAGSDLIQAVENNVWFDSIDISLSGDRNDNGFFHNIYVRFDADTAYNEVPVFVHYALRRPGQAEVIIHTSSVFTLYGTSANDWFAIESELLHSIPTGYYDLVLRVYDADYGDLLAEISGNDSGALADLALEDLSYDREPVVIIEEDSGSLHWSWLMALLLLAPLRKQALRRRRA
ncbi:choice-of-anchor H family protein [Rheinheimera marina]|uniref:Choice-of-anchor H family protein n=1 Tax=Rheinheimera marina TaxID=1774958 RepID=A0ABV9JP96_9GAMM